MIKKIRRREPGDYRLASLSGYDVSFVKWTGGHDVFRNLSLDGRTLAR